MCLFTTENLWLKPKDYNFLRNGPCSHKFKLGDKCLPEYIKITKQIVHTYTVVWYLNCNIIIAGDNLLA